MKYVGSFGHLQGSYTNRESSRPYQVSDPRLLKTGAVRGEGFVWLGLPIYVNKNSPMTRHDARTLKAMSAYHEVLSVIL